MDATTTGVMSSRANFNEMLARATKGDKEALAAMRKFLDSNSEVWERVGRLAIETELAYVAQISDGDPLVEESVLRTLKQMRSDLGGAAPTPLESMAVERVVATWLALQLADKAVIAVDSGGTLPNANFALRRQELANRHYTAAVKSLNEVQRLLPKAKQSKTASSTGNRPELHIFAADEGTAEAPSPSLAAGTA